MARLDKPCLAGGMTAGVALLLTLAACDATQASRYLLHNSTGQILVAVTISDTAGGQGMTTGDVPDDQVELLQAGWRKRAGDAVTVQWLGGAGLARWREATLPLKIDKTSDAVLHVILRPDGLVCASEDDNAAALAQAPGVNSARFACGPSTELAPLAPGMARGLTQGTVTRKTSFFAEHGGGTPVLYQTLTHKTGQVALFGEDEFSAALPLGQQSAWLVRAMMAQSAGMFIVTAGGAGWTSRFLGTVEQLGGPLPPSRVMFAGPQGYRLVVDTVTADIFLFPGRPNRDYWILGQSTDGTQLAIAMPERELDLKKVDEAVFNLMVINLAQGKVHDDIVAALPALPHEAGIETFYGAWYTEHCTWTPRLSCRKP